MTTTKTHRPAYTRHPITDALPGDEVFHAGEWIKLDRIIRRGDTVLLGLVGGGSHTGPIHHFGEFAVRREVAEPVEAAADSQAATRFQVGDGVTTHIGSDAHAWTVIAVSASGKTITIQRDIATLDPTFKPDVIPGGFVGHVVNNRDQSYTYAADPNGVIRKARLTKRGWRSEGLPVTAGRREFYDYNF